MHIMKHLQASSLLQLSAVNKMFNAFARQPVLWRRLYVKDFGRNYLTISLFYGSSELDAYFFIDTHTHTHTLGLVTIKKILIVNSLKIND